VRVECVLPFGLVDATGRRARKAVLTSLTGHGEMMSAGDDNPFRAALALLASCTVQIGAVRDAELDAGRLGELIPLDRDYLLLQLDRWTFGDARVQTVECPRAACGRRIDVQFSLSSIDWPAVPDTAVGAYALADGRTVAFRLPTAEDQVALHGLAASALEAAFLTRCVREGEVGAAALLAMPAAVRAGVVRHIVAASPALDLAVPLECVACRHPFRFVFDPVRSLLAELTGSRTELIKQVHRLALNYHWSQAEILGLPRVLRHEYLELVQGEAGR